MSLPLVYTLSEADTDTEIRGVQFSVVSDAEIDTLSSVNVTTPTLYERGGPRELGLLDNKLGTLDRRLLCATCGRDCKDCPGHTGAIHFPIPLYNPIFMDIAVKVLRTTCFFCSRLCSSDNSLDKGSTQQPKNVFSRQYQATRLKKKCIHCQGPCADYTRDDAIIELEWPTDVVFASPEEEAHCRKPFTVLDAYNILNLVSDEDARAMGFDTSMCHPRNFVMWSLLVPSMAIRPSVMTSEGSRKRGQDDLTIKLQEITKHRNDLKALMEEKGWTGDLHNNDSLKGLQTQRFAMDEDIWAAWDRIQVDVSVYMNNGAKLKKLPVRSSVATKSVMCKLKGKDGRIRSNLMGKRVNFCARTVITPDANIDIEEIGVPHEVALKLTVPERVNMMNITALTEAVKLGHSHLGGAATIITDKGTIYELQFCKYRNNIRLQYGWVVERFLRDGDYVMFNRQPSLHRNSIMGHKVRLMSGETFRLNLSCAAPYNADFDGDEMNMHVPQNPMAQAEVKTVMAVPNRLISPNANKPVMGIVQDSLLGAYLMSHLDTFVTKRQAMRLLSCIVHPLDGCRLTLPEPAIYFPRYLWTGKQILELIMPRISIGRVQRKAVPELAHSNLVVRAGRILMGNLRKGNLGAVSCGIIQRTNIEKGSEICARFMSDIQRVSNKWLLDYGFSVGIGDCTIPDACDSDMRQSIDVAFKHVDAISAEIPSNESILSDVMVDGTVTGIVSRVTMQVGGHIKYIMSDKNALVAMINSGSKGNPINLSQIMGCVGQNCVNGQRISADPRLGRGLPMYPFNDASVNGRGFVSNSYVLGLEPDEYFFHAMGGREGLVDTAVKTAVTGYIQRRMVKAGESKRATWSRSICESNNHIVEVLYGGDGMDPIHLERVPLHPLEHGDKQIYDWCGGGVESTSHKNSDRTDEDYQTMKEEAANLIRLRNDLRKLRLALGTCSEDLVDFHLPYNVESIMNCIVDNRSSSVEVSSLRACVVKKKVDAVVAEIKASGCNNSTAGVVFATHYFLCSQNVINNKRLSCSELDGLIERIKTSFFSAFIKNGEMVGCIAAQSIGEKCTQMTLNTFHLAGVLQNVTTGVSRFKELIDLSKSAKTPTMSVSILPSALDSALDSGEPQKQYVEGCAASLEGTFLSSIVEDVRVVPASEVYDSATWGIHSILREDDHEPLYDFAGCIHLKAEECFISAIRPWNVGIALEDQTNHAVRCAWSSNGSSEWMVLVEIVDIDALAELYNMTKSTPGVSGYDKDYFGEVLLAMVRGHIVSGIVNVSNANAEMKTSIVEDKAQDSKICSTTIPVVSTMGSSLYDLQDYAWVDWCKSISNDVLEVNQVLGLEAAVSVLTSEITKIISHDGSYVNQRHIMLIVNTMSHRGYLMPLSRHGINRTDSSVLVRSSFEETGDVLKEAAVFGERDDVQGVSQSIMLGQNANIGSGSITVYTKRELNMREQYSSVPRTLVKSRVRAKREATKQPREVRLVHAENGGHPSATSSWAHNSIEYPYTENPADRQQNKVTESAPFLGGREFEPPYEAHNANRSQNTCSIEGVEAQDTNCTAAGMSSELDESSVFDRQTMSVDSRGGYIPSSPVMCKWK